MNILHWLFNKDELQEYRDEVVIELRPVWKREGLREFQEWASKHKGYTRSAEIVDEYIQWEADHAKTPQL